MDRIRFKNRDEAGILLAEELANIPLQEPLVIALPRGGVPIAAHIAERLKVAMDVLILRKIGAPDQPEFGIGAIAEEGLYWLNNEVIERYGYSESEIEATLESERREVKRRVLHYRKDRPLPKFKDRDVILVDDGIATGVTALVAAQFLQKKGARSVILAVPVCPQSKARELRGQMDRVLCLEEPENFYAVGLWYEDFPQLSDIEVERVLDRFHSTSRKNSYPLSRSEDIILTDSTVSLEGHLTLPSECRGIVIFAHGSGSSRLSPRNQEVARHLQNSELGTLLFDLLTPEEAEDRTNVFNIPLLANRLCFSINWLKEHQLIRDRPLGFFGASTGAAAALWAAADLGDQIAAVVSRGGRPDLALPRLKEVTAPTLLLVGGEDRPVIPLNEKVLPQLSHAQLITVPHATHLFEEPGTLEIVSREAEKWFVRNFSKQWPRRTHHDAA